MNITRGQAWMIIGWLMVISSQMQDREALEWIGGLTALLVVGIGGLLHLGDRS